MYVGAAPLPIRGVVKTTTAKPVVVTPPKPVPTVAKPVAVVPKPAPVAPPSTVAPAPPPALAPQPPVSGNPYPTGVKVAGTGPNGSSTIWRTGFHTGLGIFVADTAFGIAPIYKDSQFGSIVKVINATPYLRTTTNENFEFHSQLSIDNGVSPAQGPYTLDLGQGIDINGNPLAGMVELYSDPGSLLTIKTSSGGTQTIWYTKDASGYNIPSHAQGTAKPSVGLFDQLIMAGAIIGASIALAGAAGVLGPTTAGPGPAALAGAPSDLAAGSYTVAAAPAFTAPAAVVTAPVTDASTIVTPPQPPPTPPEIANFTPTPVPPSAPLPPDLGGPLTVSNIGVGAGTGTGVGTGLATGASTGGNGLLTGLKTAGAVASLGATIATTVAKISAPTGQPLPAAQPIRAPVPVPSGRGLFSLPSPSIGTGGSSILLPLVILAAVLLVAHGSD